MKSIIAQSEGISYRDKKCFKIQMRCISPGDDIKCVCSESYLFRIFALAVIDDIKKIVPALGM